MRTYGAACEERRIEFITGCEFTVELDGFELHLLGYFLDLDCSRLRKSSEVSTFAKIVSMRWWLN